MRTKSDDLEILLSVVDTGGLYCGSGKFRYTGCAGVASCEQSRKPAWRDDIKSNYQTD